MNPTEWDLEDFNINNHIIDAEEFERNVKRKEQENTPLQVKKEQRQAKRKKRSQMSKSDNEKSQARRRSQNKPPQP